MMKRFLAGFILALLWMLPLGILAENLPDDEINPDGLIVSVRVIAPYEIALKAPASGNLAPFTLRAGDTVKAGDTVLTVEPQKVYAEVDGTVAAIYAQAGESADAAAERYGSVLVIERVDRYEVKANVRTGYNSTINRNPYVGTKVYLRSANEKNFADGLITAVDGRNITVAVIGGDLVFTEDVKIYRTPDYRNNSLLARSSLSVVAPATATASGTLISMDVKENDPVKAGDLLFTYVPDVLDPVRRGRPDATAVKAETDLVIADINVNQGAGVQEGQSLLIAYPAKEFQLSGQVEEADLKRLHPGDNVSVRFEELGLGPVEATLATIASLGSDEDPSQFRVYFDFVAPEGVTFGMHGTVEK